MKTHTPLTSLFLLLSVGCSDSIEQTAMEVVVSHIAGAESADRQQQYKSDESLTATQWPDDVVTVDSLQDSEDSFVEPPTAIVDSRADVLARRQIEEVASGSSEFAVVSALLLEYDLATISDADRQKLAELIHQAKLYDEQQRAALAMQDAFFAVSNSLQVIPPGPLVVTHLLSRTSADVERSNRLLNMQNEVELIVSRRLQQISEEVDSRRRSTAGSECRSKRLLAGE